MKLQAGGGEVRLFSATKRQGIDEVSSPLWQWAHPATVTVHAAPAPES
jgi:GTP-binding protein